MCTANHTCECRAPSSGNLLKNPNFNPSPGLSVWSPSPGATYVSDDVDACPGSGALKAVVTPEFDFGHFSQCVSVGVSAGVKYYFGVRYKQSDQSALSCQLFFYSDTTCSTGITGGSAVLNGIGTPVTSYLKTSVSTTSPSGARSAQVQCNTQGADLIVDQFYLNTVDQF